MLQVSYALFINVLLFCLMGSDKKRARKGAWRIPEKYLLGAGIAGGGFGGLLAMKLFHHKTRKKIFHFSFWIGCFLLVIFLITNK